MRINNPYGIILSFLLPMVLFSLIVFLMDPANQLISKEAYCEAFLKSEQLNNCNGFLEDAVGAVANSLMWSLVVSAVGALFWVVTISYVKVYEPQAAMRKRPLWIFILLTITIIVVILTYLRADPTLFSELARNKLVIGNVIIGTFGFYLGTMVGTPYLIRGSVPLGTVLGNWLRFP